MSAQLPASPAPVPPGPTLDERRATLDAAIQKYVKKGFRVESRTDPTAQLIKPKRLSCLIGVLTFLLLGIGLIIYLIWYAAQKDEQIYLVVDDKNKLSETKRKG